MTNSSLVDRLQVHIFLELYLKKKHRFRALYSIDKICSLYEPKEFEVAPTPLAPYTSVCVLFRLLFFVSFMQQLLIVCICFLFPLVRASIFS
jgi:hypothetical protein